MQSVDNAEVEELLSNDNKSHIRLQQVLRALNHSQLNPFAPPNFDEDTTDFILEFPPRHVPLFVEERAQLDLLRILDKTGASLQSQDKTVDWACQNSHVHKLHNGGDGEDFGYAAPSQAGSPF